LEIYYSIPSPFHYEYPTLETFLIINNHDINEYRLYSREFDYTMPQVYHIFKRMSIFIQKQ
jgi:hypothetical protein